jgi:CheY-like chemotaxis protein
MGQDILVIDDDPVVTRMLSRVLNGHNVIIAHSGSEALEQLSQRKFALILCDLTMPGMSGMGFFEAVRDISPDLAERIVFMTGGAFTAESHEFLNQHPDAWLEKPFDIRVLRELIRTRAEA